MDTHKIQAAGLTGKIYQVNDSPRWQLEFRHPHTQKRLRISTGLRDLVMAKEKAKGRSGGAAGAPAAGDV
jgi:hypothetical protein